MAQAVLGSPYQTDQSSLTLANTYADHPWTGIETNKRTFYYPILRDIYRANSVFSPFITFTQNLGAVNAKDMTITTMLDPHVNTDQIDLRAKYANSLYVDSRALDITFARYGGKVAYEEYDGIVSYWQTQGGMKSLPAIRAIMMDKLGLHMVKTQDRLARNALLSVPYRRYANRKTSFADLTPDDKATTGALREVHLGMKYRNVPYAQRADGSVGNIVCITSPGVLYDIRNQNDQAQWTIPQAYAQPQRLLHSEVGTFQDVRFVESPECTLFNAGAIVIQATVTAEIYEGDGAPNPSTTKVDSTYRTGQVSRTHYVQLHASTDMTKFAIGDYVTVHVQKTNDFGVSGGVDFRDGTAQHRRIVDIDVGNTRLVFELPIMTDFSTALGGGAFAYVTKATHIHAMIFVGGSDGIVGAVGRAPKLNAPVPIDDYNSMYRFSWDSYQGYGNYNPDVVEILFVGGSFRNVGDIQTPAP